MDEDEGQRVVELFRYLTYEEDTSRLRWQSHTGDQDEQHLKLPFHDPKTATANRTVRTSNPDITLLALCQFAATRLDAQVVGISLLGRHGQYILAQATQSLELDGAATDKESKDGEWLDITQEHWHYDLCQKSIHTQAQDSAEVPLYGISDFSLDAGLGTLSCVKGPPFLRSFWSTPVYTAKSYKIGVLWLLDGKVRQEPRNGQMRFMGAITSLVMRNLESRKESIERQKVLRVVQAIDYFIDGAQENHDARNWDSSARDASAAPAHLHSLDASNQSQSDVQAQLQGGNSSNSDTPTVTERSQVAKTTREENIVVSKPETSADEEMIDSNDKHDRDLVYARASYLIRDSLAMQGCVFFDTSAGFLVREYDSERPRSGAKRGNVARTGSYNAPGDPSDQRTRERLMTLNGQDLLMASYSEMNASMIPHAEVLGFALHNFSSLNGNRLQDADDFPSLEEDFLLQLTRKYPNGTIWLFREDDSLSTSTDEGACDRPSASESASPSKRNECEHREAEVATLKKGFPQVRQILFVPLFEAELSRATAGCFAFTTDVTRILSAEAELGFIKSFVNSVGAQVARINAVAADKSKNAFIGSISHELRSPLHGILAAAEFLEDTNLDTYQKSLISTQVSCGKTLLQVIEHVLDYSKINSFEKDAQAASQQGSSVFSDRIRFGSRMQNLYANTDIAELCEEVVEGSVAGKSHMQSDHGVIGSSAESYARLDQGEWLSKQRGHKDDTYGFNKNVAVILDFDYQKDWTYVTQPGALRRVLMNILGNSLKYTASGCIRVRLGVQPFDDPIGELSSIMTLSVSDTGRGISQDFLRRRLFDPFSQEDHLSTGCGLGLSIVKSLVNNLKGSMEVRSEQGVGTTVSLEIPLSRSEQNHSAEHSVPSVKPAEAENLCLSDKDLRVGFVGFKSDGRVKPPAFEGRDGTIKESIMKSVANCMVDWLQMRPYPESDEHVHEADYVVILVDERITDFIQPYVEDVQKQQPRVIALLASEMRRREVEDMLGRSIRAFEVMSAPFGPRKMARAVAACEKAAAQWKGQYRRPPPLTTLEQLKALQTDLDVESYLLQRDDLIIRPRTSNANLPDRSQSTQTLHVADTPQQREPPCEHEDAAKASSPSKSDSTHNQRYSPRKARLLLVDDNAVNVRLLETFMRKRQYNYTCAEDGLRAVEAFRDAQQQQKEKPGSAYRIIFMDISMPVMDGLEATRAIRKLEQTQREEYDKEKGSSEAEGAVKSPPPPPPPPALIVALTGLANSRDQTSAFASGVDLFMTKPVKFKEIGRLLDDWFQGNEGASAGTINRGT